MSAGGLLKYRAHFGAYNAVLFCSFLDELFSHFRAIGRGPCWIIMDNVRFHHSQSVSACVQSAGHTLVFLPAYSPMLNPIESLFGKWKTLIRSDGVAFTQDVLLEKMENKSHDITISDCCGWIRETNRNLALCLTNHVFI
jgi:transposase